MNLQRIPLWDYIRAIGIIAIVLGHTDAPFRAMLYLFHVQLFFYLAGMLWVERSVEKKSAIKFFSSRLRRLYLPYLIVNFLVYLARLVVSAEVFSPRYLFGMIIGSNTDPLVGASWFLPVLFVAECALFLWTRVADRVHISFHLFPIISLLIGEYAVFTQTELIGISKDVLLGVGLIWIGMMIARLQRGGRFKKISFTKTRLSIFIVCAIVYLLFRVHQYSYLPNLALHHPSMIFDSLIGFFCAYACARLLEHAPQKMQRAMQFIGANTIQIVFGQFLAFKVVHLILIALTGISASYYYELYGKSVIPHFWIVYGVFGVGLPLLLTVLRLKKSAN